MVNTNSLYTCSLFYVKKAWLKKKTHWLAHLKSLWLKQKLIKLLVKKVCRQSATISLL